MNKVAVLIFCNLLIFSACDRPKLVCLYTKEQLTRDFSGKTFQAFLSDTASQSKDYGKDSIVGGLYRFYRLGQLKDYSFTVKRTYDTSKAFIKENGGPYFMNVLIWKTMTLLENFWML